MTVFLEDIIGRLLFAIPLTAIWTVASMLIMAILYKIIVNEDSNSTCYFDNYVIITNYILIFLCLVIFYNGNIELF